MADPTSSRKMGVEEELMLVDPDTWTLAAVSQEAVRASTERTRAWTRGADGPDRTPEVEHELFLQQLETATSPHHSLEDLLVDLRGCRRAVGESARAVGAIAVAMPTPVLPEPDEQITPKPRYQRIYDEYGEIARHGLVCAMHVHVDVSDDEEAVAVIDGIRPWLPVLLALSANSPYWHGLDTGYASWRSQAWSRWPSTGPAEAYGTAMSYGEVAEKMIEWGASLDPGMLYYDVRVAQHYPTVEIRVADVCTEPEEAGLVTALARALVDTCAKDWRAGTPTARWRSELLRVASWRAAKFGMAGPLVHPQCQQLSPFRETFDALLDYVAGSLSDSGDEDFVRGAFARMTARGSGAARQRRRYADTGSLEAVVEDLSERTERSWHETE